MSEPSLPPDVDANLRELAAMRDEDIDYSDIPEITDFRGFAHRDFAIPHDGARLVAIERDLIEWFRLHGDPDEPMARRVNRALSDWVAKADRRAA